MINVNKIRSKTVLNRNCRTFVSSMFQENCYLLNGKRFHFTSTGIIVLDQDVSLSSCVKLKRVQ